MISEIIYEIDNEKEKGYLMKFQTSTSRQRNTSLYCKFCLDIGEGAIFGCPTR